MTVKLKTHSTKLTSNPEERAEYELPSEGNPRLDFENGTTEGRKPDNLTCLNKSDQFSIYEDKTERRKRGIVNVSKLKTLNCDNTITATKPGRPKLKR